MGATKAQERKAIEQIATILEGLGSDSYLNTALEGCLEIAEENITNDFADSYKARYQDAIKKCNEYADRLATALEDIQNFKDQLARADELIKRQADEIEAKKARIDELNAQIDQGCEVISREIDARHNAEKEAEAGRAEITILKARLYDLMTQ